MYGAAILFLGHFYIESDSLSCIPYIMYSYIMYSYIMHSYIMHSLQHKEFYVICHKYIII